jgi:hypothetical protein
MSALAGLTDAAGVSLTDRVTFATLNVFGRNLNAIQKVTDRTGRDHYGNHSVMVMIGKNIKAGVVGGLVAGSTATSPPYQAGDIDSGTGAQVTGGDVPATQSQAAAVRTLGAALGLPDSIVAGDYTAGAGGKIVTAALANVPST